MSFNDCESGFPLRICCGTIARSDLIFKFEIELFASEIDRSN